MPLLGEYWAGTAACALAAVEAFAGAGDMGPVMVNGEAVAGSEMKDVSPAFSTDQIDPDLVQQAFAAMTSPGRLEVVRRSPLVVIDSAHNPAGMAAAVAGLTEAFTFTDMVGGLAVSAGKGGARALDAGGAG